MVMGVGFLALAGVLIMSEGVLSGLVAGQNTTATVRAFYASESVLQEGVSCYLKDVSEEEEYVTTTTITATSSLTFSNGVQPKEITITPIPGTYRFTVKGEAENASNNSLRRVVKTLTSQPSTTGLDHALYSAGSATTTIGGNAEVFGSVYSLGSLEIQNASGENKYTINGNAYSSNSVNPFGDNSINGGILGGHWPIPAPDIKAEYYKDEDSETYFTSNSAAQECIDSGACDNKVVYIDVASGADIKINSTSTVSIVTPSDLVIKGGTFIAPENYPAIVTDGKLKTLGNTKIYGLVIVGGEGKSNLSNNTKFTGSVIFTNENVDLTGLGTINITYDNSTFADITKFKGLQIEPINTASLIGLFSWHEE